MMHFTPSCSRTGHAYDNLCYDILKRPHYIVPSASVSFLPRCPEHEHSCWMRRFPDDEVLGGTNQGVTMTTTDGRSQLRKGGRELVIPTQALVLRFRVEL